MILSETHIVKASNELDDLTFKCKNLYNKANYVIRQEFINNGKYISKFDMFTLLKDDVDYLSIGSTRISRCILRTLDGNWKGFFESIKDWKKNKSKYKGKPNLPKYLNKNGKFNAIFIDTSIHKPSNKKTGIGLATLKLRINTKINYKSIKEVNIKPLPTSKYKINIIYEITEPTKKPNNNNYCSIDLGLNNLMSLTSNKPGLKPVLVNGRPLKSINQFYNKQKAKFQSELPKEIFNSKKINNLSEKRSNKINDYLHKSSNYLINWCLENNLNTIVIGYNEFWKTEINIGKRNNQNFVNIPFQRLVQMIDYKSRLSGLAVIKHEESYTSKCSFLDLESLKKHDTYKGTRSKRGLFISSKGQKINADVNGSLNILRKAVPNIFLDGIEGVAVHPKRVKSFK
jgi:putative transposase